MKTMETPHAGGRTRREFLRTSTVLVAGTAIASTLPRPGYAAGDDTIKVALIGCGGRGSGAAAQALSTSGPTRLWAMADVFEHRLQSSLAGLQRNHQAKLDVPRDRQFVGFDGYKKA